MKDNIVNFSSFKKKKDSDPREQFDIAIAKKIIASDKELTRIFSSLQIPEDQAAQWIVFISELQNKIAMSVYEAHEKAGFDVAFAGLVVQALAQASADELTALGFVGEIPKNIFEAFQTKAMKTIAKSEYMEEDTLDDDFLEGEQDE